MNGTETVSKPLVVLLGTAHDQDGVSKTKELANIATVKVLPDEIDPTNLSDTLFSQMVAIVAAVQCEINQMFLDRCPNLRIVVGFGMGTNNIDLEYAGQLGIIVCNIPDYGIEEVADSYCTFSHSCSLSTNHGIPQQCFEWY